MGIYLPMNSFQQSFYRKIWNTMVFFIEKYPLATSVRQLANGMELEK